MKKWLKSVVSNQTKGSLGELEERYRIIFEQSADSIVLIDAATGALVEFNEAARKNLGYTRQEFKKLKIPDFEVIESNREVAKHIKKILKQGSDTFATQHKTKSGQIRDILVNSKTISIGGKNLIQSIWRDITEQKKEEEALRTLEERFQQVTENSLVWVWEVDKTGLYTYASPAVAKILGRRPGEIVGKRHFYDFFYPPEREEMKARTFKTFAKKQLFHGFINQNVHKNGRAVWLSTSGAPICDKKGNLLGYRGVDTDISETKRAEEELRRVNERLREEDKLKTDFVSNVTHELRTPMTSIKGYTELILAGGAGEVNQRQREFLATVKNNADHLTRLINDLLDISCLESHKLELHLATIDIPGLIHEIAKAYQVEAKARRISVELDLPKEYPFIKADSDRIKQVLTNLMGNALKFTPSEGKIVLGFQDKEKEGLFWIKNTGAGIARKDWKRIFEKFQQVGKRSEKGTGLGLAITKGLVELHRGRIWMKSEMGAGSTFYFTLPKEGGGE
jgi:PAS domain S-box-containing protein